MIDAAYAAAHEVYDEISAENADFKAIIDNVKAFRNKGYLGTRWRNTPTTPS